MKPLTCPVCGLELTADMRASWLVCPRCYNPFENSGSSQWALLVVPILAILHYVHFLL